MMETRINQYSMAVLSVMVMQVAAVSALNAQEQSSPSVSKMALSVRPEHCIDSWSIATDDTRLTVGVTREGHLSIYELRNAIDGWNWTEVASVFNLSCEVSGTNVGWKFKDGILDTNNGQKVTIRFIGENPSLELQSIWWAKLGRGPIHHGFRIVNRSTNTVSMCIPPSMFLDFAGPANEGALTMWTFHTDGGTPDERGVYQDVMTGPAVRQIESNPERGLFIPYAIFDGNGKHGVYIGIEWSVCRITAGGSDDSRPVHIWVRAGESEKFRINVDSGETFEAPPAFVGTYCGDVDDAGNSLRRHLFAYSVPAVIRDDTNYPKVQWNAFGATGDKPGSWNCLERKFYSLVDDIAPLGFEEVMIDVGWWRGGTKNPELAADPADWPSGMDKAAEYAHKAGLRFGLYWNKCALTASVSLFGG